MKKALLFFLSFILQVSFGFADCPSGMKTEKKVFRTTPYSVKIEKKYYSILHEMSSSEEGFATLDVPTSYLVECLVNGKRMYSEIVKFTPDLNLTKGIQNIYTTFVGYKKEEPQLVFTAGKYEVQEMYSYDALGYIIKGSKILENRFHCPGIVIAKKNQVNQSKEKYEEKVKEIHLMIETSKNSSGQSITTGKTNIPSLTVPVGLTFEQLDCSKYADYAYLSLDELQNELGILNQKIKDEDNVNEKVELEKQVKSFQSAIEIRKQEPTANKKAN